MSTSNPFPKLSPSNHALTSPATSDYNCIAWAAEEDDSIWWPLPASLGYWPPGIHRAVTVQCFIDAFSTLNYKVCNDGNLETDFQKVVLYVNESSGEPTHMARQIDDGTWTSKLGKSVDISHSTPDVVGGGLYGTAKVFLKRPKV